MSQDKAQAEMELRAREWWEFSHSLSQFIFIDGQVDFEGIWEVAAAFALAEVSRAVEAERMQCAKSICVMCRNGKALISKSWIHLDTFNGNKEICKASAIYERGAANQAIGGCFSAVCMRNVGGPQCGKLHFGETAEQAHVNAEQCNHILAVHK